MEADAGGGAAVQHDRAGLPAGLQADVWAPTARNGVVPRDSRALAVLAASVVMPSAVERQCLSGRVAADLRSAAAERTDPIQRREALRSLALPLRCQGGTRACRHPAHVADLRPRLRLPCVAQCHGHDGHPALLAAHREGAGAQRSLSSATR